MALFLLQLVSSRSVSANPTSRGNTGIIEERLFHSAASAEHLVFLFIHIRTSDTEALIEFLKYQRVRFAAVW